MEGLENLSSPSSISPLTAIDYQSFFDSVDLPEPQHPVPHIDDTCDSVLPPYHHYPSIEINNNHGRGQGFAIAHHSQAGSHLSANRYQYEDDGRNEASSYAFQQSQYHMGQGPQNQNQFVFHDQLPHVYETPVDLDNVQQNIPSIQQQQTTSLFSEREQAAPNTQVRGDLHASSSIPVPNNSSGVGGSKFAVERQRNSRPRGIKKLFHCFECPDFFSSRCNRDRHMQNCHPRRKLDFCCEKCSASFGTRTGKTKHMSRVHYSKTSQIHKGEMQGELVNGRVRFFCYYPGCKKSYTAKYNVYRHVEMDHLKKRYRCKCGYEATTRYNLKVHQTTKGHC